MGSGRRLLSGSCLEALLSAALAPGCASHLGGRETGCRSVPVGWLLPVLSPGPDGASCFLRSVCCPPPERMIFVGGEGLFGGPPAPLLPRAWGGPRKGRPGFSRLSGKRRASSVQLETPGGRLAKLPVCSVYVPPSCPSRPPWSLPPQPPSQDPGPHPNPAPNKPQPGLELPGPVPPPCPPRPAPEPALSIASFPCRRHLSAGPSLCLLGVTPYPVLSEPPQLPTRPWHTPVCPPPLPVPLWWGAGPGPGVCERRPPSRAPAAQAAPRASVSPRPAAAVPATPCTARPQRLPGDGLGLTPPAASSAPAD